MVYASYLLTRSCETTWEDVPWRVLAIKMAKKTFNSPMFLYCPGCLEVIFRGHDHIESEGWKLLLAHLTKSTPLLGALEYMQDKFASYGKGTQEKDWA